MQMKKKFLIMKYLEEKEALFHMLVHSPQIPTTARGELE